MRELRELTTVKPKIKNKKVESTMKNPTLQTELKEIAIEYAEVNGLDLYYDAKQAGSLKGIIQRIKHIYKNHTKREAGREEVVALFQKILSEMPEYYRDNYDLSIINSGFNRIVNHIRAKNKQIEPKQSKRSKQSDNDFNDFINRER